MGLISSLKSLVSGNRLNVSKRFALQRETISGTMSKFYMAKDLETGRIVGFKILDAKKTADLEARYKGMNKPCEGEIAMKLKHPRIVETYEYGLTTEGAPYIVMEYLDGPDFNSVLIAKDPCLEGNRLRFILQAAEAIGAVHAAGFIHRDICARNFLLLKKTKDLKLIDFGLTVPAEAPFMQPGIRTGNPNYMAPEVVRRKPIDQRLDVFAFGVTAYEFCTHTLPWLKGTTGLAAMQHDHPPTPLANYRPEINPTLAKAIYWCLEADPAKRCPTMEKFLQAIRTVKHEDGGS